MPPEAYFENLTKEAEEGRRPNKFRQAFKAIQSFRSKNELFAGSLLTNKADGKTYFIQEEVLQTFVNVPTLEEVHSKETAKRACCRT